MAEPESQPDIRIKGPTKKRFEQIFSLGKRLKGEFARIIAHPGTGLVGIAVSKKVGSKPRRNHLKRRYREAVAHSPLKVDSRLDYVVVVNAEAMDQPFVQIQEETSRLISEITLRWAKELESS